MILVPFFAIEDFPAGAGIFFAKDNSGVGLLCQELIGILVVTVWSAFFTYVLLKAVDYTLGLRVSVDAEERGLDLAIHDESLVSRSKTDAFGKYIHLAKGNEDNANGSTTSQTKYEKYQSFVGKYLT